MRTKAIVLNCSQLPGGTLQAGIADRYGFTSTALPAYRPIAPQSVGHASWPASVNDGSYLLTYDNGPAREPFAGSQSEGRHPFDWDGRDAVGNSVNTGLHFYNPRTHSFTQTRKMLLLK